MVLYVIPSHGSEHILSGDSPVHMCLLFPTGLGRSLRKRTLAGSSVSHMAPSTEPGPWSYGIRETFGTSQSWVPIQFGSHFTSQGLRASVSSPVKPGKQHRSGRSLWGIYSTWYRVGAHHLLGLYLIVAHVPKSENFNFLMCSRHPDF